MIGTPWTAPAKGRTDIDNLALVCRVCHPALHETGQTLYQTRHTNNMNNTGNANSRKEDRDGVDAPNRDDDAPDADDSYRI